MVSSSSSVSADDLGTSTRTDRGLASPPPLSAPRASILKTLSWTSIFAGAAAAAVTQILLSLLGLGIGLATVDPLAEANPTEGMGIATFIWAFLSVLISLGVGGLIAGYIAGASRIGHGFLHGLMVWAVATLLTVYILTTSAAALAGGGLQIASRNADQFTQRGSALSQILPAVPGVTAPTTAAPGATPDLTPSTPGATGNRWDETQIRQRADIWARDTSRAAFWTFGGLALGAVAACLMGRVGEHRGRDVSQHDSLTGAPITN